MKAKTSTWGFALLLSFMQVMAASIFTLLIGGMCVAIYHLIKYNSFLGIGSLIFLFIAGLTYLNKKEGSNLWQ